MSENKHRSKKPLADTMKGGDYSYIEPVQARPLEVKVYDSFEKSLKYFRSLVQKERILSTYKEKQRFEKPSDKKRRVRAENKRKLMELETKDANNYQKKERVKELKTNDDTD